MFSSFEDISFGQISIVKHEILHVQEIFFYPAVDDEENGKIAPSQTKSHAMWIKFANKFQINRKINVSELHRKICWTKYETKDQKKYIKRCFAYTEQKRKSNRHTRTVKMMSCDLLLRKKNDLTGIKKKENI